MPLIWPTLRYFRPTEFGDAEVGARLDGAMLLALDALRGTLGSPILIHAGAIVAPRPATPDSQHPLGRAVDCHAPGVPLLDFWLLAERFGFRGIGLYPFTWIHPGLHLDMRDAPLRARWWQDDAGRYRPVTGATLTRLSGLGFDRVGGIA